MVYEVFCMTWEKCTIFFNELIYLHLQGLSIFHISVLDTNDRFLRKITVGQGPLEKGHTREVTKPENNYFVSVHVLYEIVFLSGMFKISLHTFHILIQCIYL